MIWNEIHTKSKIIDLGEIDSSLAGIYSPLYDENTVNKYIHKQFLENSLEYVNKYQNNKYWESLLAKAIQTVPLNIADKYNILDIGSGAGNTIFPLLNLFINSTVIASDLSLPLLRSLNDFKSKNYSDSSCYVMQLNAENIVFEDNQFDIVVGGAILHHLFDPAISLSQVYNVLKPNGVAIFFEPFEIGNQIISMILNNISRRNIDSTDLIYKIKKLIGLYPKQTLPDKVINFFKKLSYDFEVRKGQDKSGEIYKKIDDKWLFTKKYLKDIADSIGYNDLIIYPIHDLDDSFYNQINSYLKLGLGISSDTLPKWAADYIKGVDGQFSLDAKADLLIEGCIILKK